MSGRPTRGLRSDLPEGCRSALRRSLPSRNGPLPAEVGAHIASCAFCDARLRAARVLASAVGARPAAPQGVSPDQLLAGVFDRVVESAENGPVGSWVASAVVPTLSHDEQPAWQEAVADAGAPLAGAIVRAPAGPPSGAWSRMQRSILDEVAVQSRADRAPRVLRRALAVTGAAAALVLSIVLFAQRSPRQPTITFTELSRAPDVDFAVVRYGFRR